MEVMGMHDENEDKRHPSTEHMLTMLTPNPNLTGRMWEIANEFSEVAAHMIGELEDSPELTAGLRKLLEAKDCFIRAAVFGPTVDYRDR
jgi:hypothetical protein